jgi:uncharacterized protein
MWRRPTPSRGIGRAKSCTSLAAAREDRRHEHPASRRDAVPASARGSPKALESATNSDRPVGLCWVVVNAFLGITTKPSLFAKPLRIEEAWELVERWLEHENVRIVQETGDHARLWSELSRQAGTGESWSARICIAARATTARIETLIYSLPEQARLPARAVRPSRTTSTSWSQKYRERRRSRWRRWG